MRKTYGFFLMWTFAGVFALQGQTVVFEENFVTQPFNVTSAGHQQWQVNDSLFFMGSRSLYNTVGFQDTSFLTTHSFSTVGYNFVRLSFAHICKIAVFDGAYLEVSKDNGVNWTRLDAQTYYGSGQFGSMGNRFTAASYPQLWYANNNSALPQNNWWVFEMFDLSSLVANQPHVKLRFVIYDGGNPSGPNNNYGWLIDAVKVETANHELMPPQINHIAPFLKDTIYGTGPFDVFAHITDSSGILSAHLHYTINSSYKDSLPMNNIGGDVYTGTIPQIPLNSSVAYYIKAVDSTPAANTAIGHTHFFYNTKAPYKAVIGQNALVATESLYSPFPRISSTSPNRFTASNKIFTSDELVQAGIHPFSKIDAIAYKKHGSSGTLSANPLELQIFIRQSHQNPPLCLRTTIDGIQNTHKLVYSNSDHIIPSQSGWMKIALDTPFIYTGGHLEIAVKSSIAGTPPYSEGTFDWVYSPGFSDNVIGTMSTVQLHKYAELNLTSGLRKQRPVIAIIRDTVTYAYDAGVVDALLTKTVVNTHYPESLFVQVKNYGTQMLNSVEVSYSVNNSSYQSTSWNGQLQEDMWSDPFYVGQASFMEGYNSLKIWTSQPNMQPDLNNFNDTLHLLLYGCAEPLQGYYSVGGSGADYPDFKSIIKDLEKCGLGGHVIIEPQPGVYNERIIINNGINTNDSSTVTFRGSANVVLMPSLPASNKSAAIELNGARHFYFDSLTISIPDTALWGTGIYIGNHSKDIKITNCSILVHNNSPNDSFHGILVSGNPTSYTAGGQEIQNIMVAHNVFKGGYYGVCIKGDSSNISNVRLIKNKFKDAYRSSVSLNNVSDFTVSHNHAVMRETSIMGARVIDASVSKGPFTITHNKIKNPSYLGISLSSVKTAVDTFSVVANNAIGGGFSGTIGNAAGIYINNSSRIKVLHNSINCDDVHGVGFHVTPSSSDIVVKNNCFVYSGQGNGFAARIEDPLSIKAIDYNNYFSGSSKQFVYYGAPVPNLTSLKAVNIPYGNDSHAVSGNPNFYTHYWLKPMGATLYRAANFHALIADDIEGTARDTLYPTIGAYEQILHHIDAAVVAISAPLSSCSLTNSESLSVEILNTGKDTLNQINISYTIDTLPAVIQLFNKSLGFGDSDIFTFNATADFSQKAHYHVFISVDAAGDGEPFNDTISEMIYTGHRLENGPYIMGFEPGEDYTLWQVVDANNDEWGWTPGYSNASFAYTGTHSAMYNQGVNSAGDDWLITECFMLNGGATYDISFMYRANNASYPHLISFMSSKTQDVNTFTDTLIFLNLFDNTLYQKASVYFQPADTGVYYFAWHGTSPHVCYIDDFSVALVPFKKDIGVTAIMGSDSLIGAGTQKSVSAVVKNFGTQNINHFDILYLVNNDTIANQTWTGTLLPGVEDTIKFAQKYTVPNGYYTVCVHVFLVDDQDSSNNYFCKTFFGSPVTAYSDYQKAFFYLSQNMPNPAKNSTEIVYKIPEEGLIHFQIFNTFGEMVYSYSGYKKAGRHMLIIEAAAFSRGIYLYTLYYKGMRKSRKMIIE